VLHGKWRLDALLGVGGMACVYASTHRNKKRGAVKLLHAELAANLDVRNRFLREGYVANTVDHPGAVSVLDDDVTEDGSVFLVMELLEGQSVEACASGRPLGRLVPGEVIAIAERLLDVLASAHDKGIVHRDLKPENLFLTRRGELKVLDFGIARLREGASSSSATRTGSMMGTPAFLPPEQARGYWNKVDARTDLWAVGATMFTLLTGRYVHEAETINTLLLAAMTEPAPRLATVQSDAAPSLAAIVDRALAFAQEDRWQSAQEMQSALRQLPEFRQGLCALPALAGPVGSAPVRPLSQPQADPAAAYASAPHEVRASPVSAASAPAVSGLPGLTASPVSADPQPREKVQPRAFGMAIGAGAVVMSALAIGAFAVLRSGGDAPAEDSSAGAVMPGAPSDAVLAPPRTSEPVGEPIQSPAPAKEPETPLLDKSAPGVTEPSSPPPASAETASAAPSPQPIARPTVKRVAKPPALPPAKKTTLPDFGGRTR
jgi:serine/threonine-protein kinase